MHGQVYESPSQELEDHCEHAGLEKKQRRVEELRLAHPVQSLRVGDDELEDVVGAGEGEDGDGGATEEHECPKGRGEDPPPDTTEHGHALAKDVTEGPGGYLHGPGYGNQPSSPEPFVPELPEVEITRRHLDEAMAGSLLTHVRTSHPRTARHNAGGPAEVDQRLEGRRVLGVGRKGKFLAAPLDDGQTLVAHLGMSGRFTVGEPSEEEPAHTHFRARLDDGREVRFIDPRTFGFVAVLGDDEISGSGLSRVGPDAWDTAPSAGELTVALGRRTAPVKALLLDQVIVSGLGNIYADEALHIAGIHPLRPGGDLSEAELDRLLAAVRTVLAGAIDKGGTSLDDLAYLLPDGRAGENLDRLLVYGRADLPCPDCGTPIQRIVIRARSSHFCPNCQPERP